MISGFQSAVFVFVRAAVYSTLFVGFLLVFLPARVVAWSGLAPTGHFGTAQFLGAALVTAGAVLAVGCILSFVVLGRGTPAPFDPPRRLVVRGPYRFVRNPMYVGATCTLLGVALYYESAALATYAAGFLVAMHLFVRAYEEPTLRRSFGTDYEDYCHRVGRWWPRFSRSTT